MKNAILALIPLLVIHIVLIILFSDPNLTGDETRYIGYAENLSQGFYTNSDNPELTNGPGYPLLLAPLVALGVSYQALVWLNVVFLALGILYFYNILEIYISRKQSLLYSYLLGLHPILLKWTGYLYTESLTLLAVCGFMYHLIKALETIGGQKRNLVLASIYLGLLSLIKVFFIYLIILGFLGYGIFYLVKKHRQSLKTTMVFLGGFFVFLPYLVYCHSVTDKSFYFGTNGGEILYWSSTPFPNEYGEWIGADYVLGSDEDRGPGFDQYFSIKQLSANHKPFYQRAYSIQNHLERDQLFREKAQENIKNHPLKFCKNTLVSFSRLFFNYPNSYTPQKLTTFFYLVPNCLLVFTLIACAFILVRANGKISGPMALLGLFALLYIAGMVVLVGRVRHLLPVLPILLLLIGYILNRFVNVKLVKQFQG